MIQIGRLTTDIFSRLGGKKKNKTSTIDLKNSNLESRWCPIFKAIVAGFRGKVA